MPTTPESYGTGMGSSRQRNAGMTTRHGGRFGGPNEQRAASRTSRRLSRKVGARLTIDDYDRATV